MIAAIHGLTNGSVAAVPTSEYSHKSSAEVTASSPFGELLKSSVGNIDRLEQQARTAADGLMTGSGVDIHQAMIAAEKADMAFELALAVRNKAIQSYQSVMNMQF